MLAIERAVLVELELALDIAEVLLGCVVSAFAFGAL